MHETGKSAPRFERLAGLPRLAIERAQSGTIPLPNAVAGNRREVIGDGRHFGASSPSVSGCGETCSGSFCASLTGGARGSTTILRIGSPIFIAGSRHVVKRPLRWATCCLSMCGRGLAREQRFADQASAYVLAYDAEHLANSVFKNGCSGGSCLQHVSLRFAMAALRLQRSRTFEGACFNEPGAQSEIAYRGAASCIACTIARRSRIVATKLDCSASSRRFTETSKL